MTTRFRKASPKRSNPVTKKPGLPPKKPAKGDESKTPVTLVGEGKDHHDSLSTKPLYVLVDQPKKPQDSVVLLDHGSQVWPKLFTTDAQSIYNSLLVFVL